MGWGPAQAVPGSSPLSAGSLSKDMSNLDERYCDYAATAPAWDEALAVQATVAKRAHGNPSSLHSAGAAARKELEAARLRLCDLVRFDDGRLLATSGGTESNNLVIAGHFAKNPAARVLLAQDVHPSLWHMVERHPGRIDLLTAGSDHRLTAAQILSHLKPEHTLVCLSHACNETGIAHDVVGIAGLCARRGIPCHIDGTQALGHLPVDLTAIACDSYAWSAHKFGGPRGVGGLYVREPSFIAQSHGGKQEWQLRAGTENVAGLAAAAEALAQSLRILANEEIRLRELARTLVQRLVAGIPGLLLNSRLDDGLPGLVSISIPGLPAHPAAMELDLRGYAVATGSACHADEILPSRIVLALGRTPDQAQGTLRLSLGRGSTAATVAGLAEALVDIAAANRSL